MTKYDVSVHLIRNIIDYAFKSKLFLAHGLNIEHHGH